MRQRYRSIGRRCSGLPRRHMARDPGRRVRRGVRDADRVLCAAETARSPGAVGRPPDRAAVSGGAAPRRARTVRRLAAAQLRRRRRSGAAGPAGGTRPPRPPSGCCGTGGGRRQPRRELWFTYHLYYKAPDWLGPAVSRALGIPYVVAEASHAAKREGGAWDVGHRAVAEALRRRRRGARPQPGRPRRRPAAAARPRPLDRPAAVPRCAAVRGRSCTRQSGPAAPDRGRDDAAGRQARLLPAARRGAGDAARPRLVARRRRRRPGPRARSRPPWRRSVRACVYRGVLGENEQSPRLCARPMCSSGRRSTRRSAWRCSKRRRAGCRSWPAPAAVLPASSRSGETGLLVPPGDAAAFAAALRRLIVNNDLRARMAAAARAKVEREHDLPAAAARLAEVIGRLGRVRAA